MKVHSGETLIYLLVKRLMIIGVRLINLGIKINTDLAEKEHPF